MPGAGNADENEEDNEGKHPSLSGYYLNQYFSNFLANMKSFRSKIVGCPLVYLQNDVVIMNLTFNLTSFYFYLIS